MTDVSPGFPDTGGPGTSMLGRDVPGGPGARLPRSPVSRRRTGEGDTAREGELEGGDRGHPQPERQAAAITAAWDL